MRRECFDAIYGSSAGAINATYFLSGQREGVRIYYEDIANKKFVDLARLLDRKNEQGMSGAHLSAPSDSWRPPFLPVVRNTQNTQKARSKRTRVSCLSTNRSGHAALMLIIAPQQVAVPYVA